MEESESELTIADNAKPKTINEDTQDFFSYPPYIRNITFFSFSVFFSHNNCFTSLMLEEITSSNILSINLKNKG